jgi:hypothetical protein
MGKEKNELLIEEAVLKVLKLRMCGDIKIDDMSSGEKEFVVSFMQVINPFIDRPSDIVVYDYRTTLTKEELQFV